MNASDNKKLLRQRKNKLIQVRLDQKILRELDECAVLLGMNRSAAVRKGIELLEDTIKD